MKPTGIFLTLFALTAVGATVWLLNSDPERLTPADVLITLFVTILAAITLAMASSLRHRPTPDNPADKTDNKSRFTP